MKYISILLLFLAVMKMDAQEKLTTSTCMIIFEASVPLFEEVKAQSNEVKCVLIPHKSQITFIAIIENFEFKRNLMKSHFNNNYMESQRYPKAVFKGVIEKFDLKDITEIEKEYIINGSIEMHGQTKKISISAKIVTTINGLQLTSDFVLNADDFKIEIPSIVITKVSKMVSTHVECVFKNFIPASNPQAPFVNQ